MDFELPVTPSVEATASAHVDNDSAVFPLLGIASLQVAPHWFNDNIDIISNLKMMGSVSTYDEDRATGVAGMIQRYQFYNTRYQIIPGHLGLTKADLELTFKKPGLKFYGGIFPQEDFVYPYNFDSNTFPDGTPVNTLTNAVLDNTSGANMYTGLIGYGAGMQWDSPFLPGLKFVFQSSADGGFEPNGSWLTTEQLGYTSPEYKMGDAAAKTSLTVYASQQNPVERVVDGQTYSNKNGIGAFFSQNIGKFQFGLGAAMNDQALFSADQTLLNTYHGVNTGAQYFVTDSTLLGAGYAYLDYTEGFGPDIITQSEVIPEHAVEINVAQRLASGLTLKGGYEMTLVGSDDASGNESYFYVGLGYGATSNMVDWFKK